MRWQFILEGDDLPHEDEWWPGFKEERTSFKLPDLYYVWEWFEHLSGWREVGFTAGPIAYREVEAWSRLKQIDITPDEVEALMMVDALWRNLYWEKSNPDKSVDERPENKNRSGLAKGLDALIAARDAEKALVERGKKAAQEKPKPKR